MCHANSWVAPSSRLSIPSWTVLSSLSTETMDAMIVIGAPSWFSGALGAFKAVMSPDLQNRMEVISGDFRLRLLELIGAENLLVSSFTGACANLVMQRPGVVSA